MERQKAPFTRALIILGVVALLLLGGIAALFVKYNQVTPPSENIVFELQDRRLEYLQGVSIDGVAVDGLTVDEARERVLAQTVTPLGSVKVVSGEKEAQIDLSSLVPTRDVESALTNAIALSDVGEEERAQNVARLKQEGGQNFESIKHYDLSPLRGVVERAASELSTEPVDAQVQVLSQEERAAHTLAATTATEETSTGTTGEIAIEDLVNFVDAVPGNSVNVDRLYALVQQAIDNGDFENEIVVEGTPVPATKNLDAIKQNFTLIATASSSFAKGSYSVPNRVFNLQKAAGILNGYIIQPGEEFSCNTVFGPRSDSTGWKAAGAIANGKSVQEVGGGICQVSSTLYNTILMADLEIVNRQPHSWPLSYLPAGQDATISTGGPDFVFKNDRETPVVLLANVDTDKKELDISIYGEPLPDGLRIELRSEKTGNISQPAGTTTTNPEAVRSGRAGSTYKTYKQYYKGDTLVREEFSHDTRYRAFGSISMAGGSKASTSTAVVPEEMNDAPASEDTPSASSSSSSEQSSSQSSSSEPESSPQDSAPVEEEEVVELIPVEDE